MSTVIKNTFIHLICVVAFSVLLGLLAMGFGFSDSVFAKSLIGIGLVIFGTFNFPASFLISSDSVDGWLHVMIQIATSILWGYLITQLIQWTKSKT